MYAFDYQRPGSVAEAAKAGAGDIRYLAGGQSLVQSMKLRLASTPTLVDLGGIPDLRSLRRDGDRIVIGAMTTHATVARSKEVIDAIPALAELAGGIGDPMVRNLGTIGGSIANADPAACTRRRSSDSARRSGPIGGKSPATDSSRDCSRPRSSPVS